MNARPSFDDMAAEFDIAEPLPAADPFGPDAFAHVGGDLPADHLIGANAPPEPTPFERVAGAVNDLANEAQHWLDGDGIKSQKEADAVGKLIVMIRKAGKDADAERVREKAPLDEAVKAIQARYNPVIKRADLAVDVAKRALTPWLVKVQAAKDEEARIAREAAQAAAARAAEAAQAAAASTSLAAAEAAEAAIRDARKAGFAANKAENSTATAGGGAGGRAVGLRTSYAVTLTDDGAALHHYITTRLADVNEFLVGLARQEVAAGKRTIPGFQIDEVKGAV